jgi:TonB family protein
LRNDNIPRYFVFAIAFSFLSVGFSIAQDQQASPESNTPYRGELHSLAGLVLKGADKAGCHPNSCTVLVANFTTPSGSTSRLGIQLADSISAELLSQGSGIQAVDRSRLRDYLERERIPSSLLADAKAARWLATEFEADTVIIGNMEEQKDHLRLSVELLNASNEEKSPQYAVELSVPDLKVGLALLEPYKPEPANAPATSTQDATPPRAGFDGVGMPRCMSCPSPILTSRARDAKFWRKVALMATVTQEGRATGISIIKGAPFGLNEAAIEAASRWQFKPATKGGNLVAAVVQIEQTFKLY